MFAALGNLARSASTALVSRAANIFGKRAVAASAGLSSAALGTVAAGGKALVKRAPGAVGLAGAAATGASLAGALTAGGGGGRRRRRRRFPTANQMARFEQAKDLVKGNPTMRKALEWKFYSRYSWF